MKLSRIELFRQKLQRTLDAVEDPSDQYSQGVRAVVRALKADYDILFPVEAYKADPKEFQALIEKYCHSSINLCPICGDKVIKRKGPRGHFLGCTSYPLCKGARSMDGTPTKNAALHDFIADKVYEDEMDEQKKQQNRFANLDL